MLSFFLGNRVSQRPIFLESGAGRGVSHLPRQLIGQYKNIYDSLIVRFWSSRGLNNRISSARLSSVGNPPFLIDIHKPKGRRGWVRWGVEPWPRLPAALSYHIRQCLVALWFSLEICGNESGILGMEVEWVCRLFSLEFCTNDEGRRLSSPGGWNIVRPGQRPLHHHGLINLFSSILLKNNYSGDAQLQNQRRISTIIFPWAYWVFVAVYERWENPFDVKSPEDKFLNILYILLSTDIMKKKMIVCIHTMEPRVLSH